MAAEAARSSISAAFLLRAWFGVRLPVTRSIYAGSGFGLMAVKYAVEAGLIYYYAGSWLTPFEFLNPLLGERTRAIQGGPEWLGWALFVWTLPFVWIAFSMSVRRAASAGLSPWLGMLILVPLLNLAVMLILTVLPNRQTKLTIAVDDAEENYFAAPQSRGEYWSPEMRRDMLGEQQSESRGARMMLAIACSVAVGAGMLAIGVYGFETYGVSLFFGTPLLMGACCGFVYNRRTRQSFASTTGAVMLSLVVAMGMLLGLALEGLICILMAFPLIAPLSIFGGFIGKAIADSTRATYPGMLGVIVALPILSGAESLRGPPQEFAVLTAVDVAAPPDVVWQHVIRFPDLPPPEEWYFRMGIAAPTQARIEGHGVDATRYCEFTTGTFVEPITVWEEPRRLGFDVTEQPDPMAELSPYRHVHPPHLEQATLRSNRGEFRLIPITGGGTRLEGRTWYQFDMYPQGYWSLWSDMIIHRIHRRVLLHVKALAEKHALDRSTD